LKLKQAGEDDEAEETDDEGDEDDEDEGTEDDKEEEEEEDGSKRLLEDARRLFIWQGRQKELAKELWRSLDLGDEEAQAERMLQLSASFIFHGVGDQPFSSGLIHFLAVLGIDKEMDQLWTAKNYFVYGRAGNHSGTVALRSPSPYKTVSSVMAGLVQLTLLQSIS
ncbi:hypothetical protein H2201_008601, partial [Coniosporium apollinis]